MITTITNMHTEPHEFFFSTNHCQPNLHEWFVPVSYYTWTVEEVRDFHNSMGEIEIDNPSKDYIPDFILASVK